MAEPPLPQLPRFCVTESGPHPVALAWVRSALLSVGSPCWVTGTSAAMVRGWGMLNEPRAAVQLGIRHGRVVLPSSTIVLRQARGGLTEMLTALSDSEPFPVQCAVDTVLDCAVALTHVDAVVLADSALRSGTVCLEDLWAGVESRRRHPHVCRARRVLRLCDPQAGSVLESLTRVLFHDAGLPAPHTQLPLDGGRIRVDFAWPEARLVVEVDGVRWHPDPPRDQARDNRLAVLGWRVLRFTWGQVVHQPDLVLALVGQALGRP